ncbi:hypothetical protein QVG61_01595 [Thiohalobacter sp. IOR34]|uniref:hypothetical protein n=1 Tax=Thiohalobacter sp. IOR34 TaxID=3057176 RepID=UPI0025B26954|nr:hypothetical protein [Thiohalobacter sp. IOR34]WJW75808.1 hypothetical protein QVG61_01595 [Thiohalobacter sp. IOR34]
MRIPCRLLAGPLLGLLAVQTVVADEVDQRHGRILDGLPKIGIEGAITASWQYASDPRLDAELIASLDLLGRWQTRHGQWLAYLEGSSTPPANGLSRHAGEANADAGTALNSRGHGRLQLSELHYSRRLARGTLVIGQIDPTAFLDSSEVANDETRQFLAATLVNNPAIEFPDYTLGAVYHHHTTAERPGFTLLLASSHGLADNASLSYAELIKVNDDDKGLFSAFEVYRQSDGLTWRGGLWLNTADHETLDGTAADAANYGLYGNIDFALKALRGNLRLGFSNPAVSEAAAFASLALEQALAQITLGAGLSYSWLSGELDDPARNDSSQAELYLRSETSRRLQITTSLQWLRNSGLDRSGRSVDPRLTIVGLRIGYSF